MATRFFRTALLVICMLAVGGCSRVSPPKIAELPLEADPQAVTEFEKLGAEIQKRAKTPTRRLARAPQGFWVRTETTYSDPVVEIKETEPLTGKIKVTGHVTTWLKKKPKPDGTFDARDKRFASEVEAMAARVSVPTPPPSETEMTYEWDGKQWMSEQEESEPPFGDKLPDSSQPGLEGWAFKPW